MDGSREVRIGHDEALVLSRTPLGLQARLTLSGLTAETEVLLTVANLERPLTEWADDLADHWRGWEGTKDWETYSGQLKLSSAHDRLGHVTIVVELREFSGNGWTVDGYVSLDAGQLESFAHDVHRLMDR